MRRQRRLRGLVFAAIGKLIDRLTPADEPPTERADDSSPAGRSLEALGLYRIQEMARRAELQSLQRRRR